MNTPSPAWWDCWTTSLTRALLASEDTQSLAQSSPRSECEMVGFLPATSRTVGGAALMVRISVTRCPGRSDQGRSRATSPAPVRRRSMVPAEALSPGAGLRPVRWTLGKALMAVAALGGTLLGKSALRAALNAQCPRVAQEPTRMLRSPSSATHRPLAPTLDGPSVGSRDGHSPEFRDNQPELKRVLSHGDALWVARGQGQPVTTGPVS
jgi:hypothetical protein